MIRGYNNGKKTYFEGKNKEVHGRIVAMERTSKEKKFVKVQFADSTWYDVPLFGFEDYVQIGDSIFKRAGSYRYIIFKRSNPIDTISREHSNSFFE